MLVCLGFQQKFLCLSSTKIVIFKFDVGSKAKYFKMHKIYFQKCFCFTLPEYPIGDWQKDRQSSKKTDSLAKRQAANMKPSKGLAKWQTVWQLLAGRKT